MNLKKNLILKKLFKILLVNLNIFYIVSPISPKLGISIYI